MAGLELEHFLFFKVCDPVIKAFETICDIGIFVFGKPIFKISFFFHDVMFHDYDNYQTYMD